MLKFWKVFPPVLLAGLLASLLVVALSAPARAMASTLNSRINRPQADLYPDWQYKRRVWIDNTASSITLTNYQVKISLTALNFSFNHAQPDGRDIRFTDSDSTTLLDYWIEKYDPIGQTATLWVKVPSIPANAMKRIGLYYGNPNAASASNGSATFDFFDDFQLTAPGYYTLSAPTTVVLGNSQGWENSPIHTLSVIPFNSGGYQYWGYYGLEGGNGNIGLARSNDLVNWTKYSGNPLLPPTDDARWPQVITHAGTIYMVYNFSYVSNPSVVLRTSTDGLNFTAAQVVVPDVNNHRIGNPSLFYNPNDNHFYLYWYDNDTISGTYTIFVKSATTAAGLAGAPSTALLTSTTTLAAPDMMYYNGQYFLSTETYEAAIWRTRIYSGPTASGPFTQLPGNPVLSDNDACFFQHIFGTTMHAWYCKLTGSTWTLEHRTADLTAGQPQLAILNSAKWTLGAGTWTALTMTQQDGTAGIVAQIVGDTSHSGSEILRASYTGSDYIIEAAMRLTAGRVMGLGARVSDEDNLYTVNLYQDRDPLTNLFVYRWIADSATTLSEVNVGPISFSTWYKMTVKAHGPNIDVSLNDVPYVSTTDPLNQYPSGSLALAGEGATTAQFNDLRVRQYAAQEPTVTVAEEGPSAVTLQQFTARAAPTSNEVWLLLSTAALIVGGGIIIIRRHSSGRMTKEHHDL